MSMRQVVRLLSLHLPVTFLGLLTGFLLSPVKASGLGETPSVCKEGATPTCPNCELGFPPPNFFEASHNDFTTTSCIEWDGIPPSHCATIPSTTHYGVVMPGFMITNWTRNWCCEGVTNNNESCGEDGFFCNALR